jgi:hypothetical protein
MIEALLAEGATLVDAIERATLFVHACRRNRDGDAVQPMVAARSIGGELPRGATTRD